VKEHLRPERKKVPSRRTGSAAASAGPYEEVLRMQRQAGNAATGSWLARSQPTAAHVLQRQVVAPAAQAAAAAEADAVHTRNRLTAVLQTMLTSTNSTVRNTAQLYVASPRLTFLPMTLRSDSAAIATRLGTTGTREYLFTGVIQPTWAGGAALPAGTEVFDPGVAGTIEGSAALIRGRRTNGNPYSDRALSSFFTHETSHILVRSYGQHPNTAGDAGSFDRYKDEFRAYFIDPYDSRFGRLEPDRRAVAIRTHLVGTSATQPNPATNAYSELQGAYWTNAAFKRQVDNHTRPDGFNVTSSPRLDQLFQLLTAAGTDPARVDGVVLAIVRLPIAERTEAAGASLVATLVQALDDAAQTRVRRALTAPTSSEYTEGLNRGRSPRVIRFQDALVRGEPGALKVTYRQLNDAERARMSMDPALRLFIDRHVDQVRTRACVVAMVTTQSIDQFDAVDRFITACLGELARSITGRPSKAPAPVVALRAMTFEARIGFYRLSEEARRRFVETMPAPVSRPVIAILRGDREL
jgi:hypothetical protein